MLRNRWSYRLVVISIRQLLDGVNCAIDTGYQWCSQKILLGKYYILIIIQNSGCGETGPA